MGVGAIFVDGANISRSLTARSQGKGRPLVDYGRVVDALNRIFGVPFSFRAYYTTHRDKAALERREPFYDHLRRNGWTVFDLQAKCVVNSDHPEGMWMDKGVDLAIGLDAYRLALTEKNLTVLALATHDADFAQLFMRVPPSITGVSLGWKGNIAMDLVAVTKPVYLDEIGVLRM
jgi:uncharacterized LabA/DUF88 family protein